MKSRLLTYMVFLTIQVIVLSCTKSGDDGPVQDKYMKIAEALSSGSSFNVTFYAADSLFVGYNKTYFRISDKSTGTNVEQASISLHPLMDMVTFSHACPVENPETSLNADGYFEGAVLFSMTGTNTWSLNLEVDANGKTETVLFPISKVKATDPVKKIVVIDSLSTGPGTWAITKYPISLIPPASWQVGNNKFEFTVHKMESMMSFPPVNDLTVEITPEMPSMGHGSPNNVNPVPTGNGHYSGTVNFTMTGMWRVHLLFKTGDRTINSNAYFDIIF